MNCEPTRDQSPRVSNNSRPASNEQRGCLISIPAQVSGKLLSPGVNPSSESTKVRPTRSDVGAIVVAHKTLLHARRCVASLASQIDLSNIVVVLNAPEQANRDDGIMGEARLVSPAKMQGYGENLNFGMQFLSAELLYVIHLNDDVVLPEGAISKLVEGLEDNPRVGAVGPRFYNLKGDVVASAFRFPSVLNEIGSSVILPLRLSRHKPDCCNPDVTHRGISEWTLGAAIMIRVSAWRAVGGFDPSYFLYFEETDFALRLRNAGWKNLYLPDVGVLHEGAVSTGSQYRAVFGQSHRHYLRSHWPRWRRGLLGVGLVIAWAWNLSYATAVITVSPRRRVPTVTTLRDLWAGRAL